MSSNKERTIGCTNFIIGCVLDLIVAAICYFGGVKELSWLCIVGFVCAGLNIIASLFVGGIVSLISKILLVVVGYFWLIPKVFIEKGGELGAWLVGNGANDIFYFARMFALLFAFAIILEFLDNLDALHGGN